MDLYDVGCVSCLVVTILAIYREGKLDISDLITSVILCICSWFGFVWVLSDKFGEVILWKKK